MKASVKNNVPDPGGHLYIVVVKELFSFKYILLSAFYKPSHEHPNALLMAVQKPTVDCCAAEMLPMFVEGTGPLANIDYVGEAARGIVRQ